MFRLFRYYVLASSVAIVVVTVVLVAIYRQNAVNELILTAEGQNTALARSFANTVWPVFSSYVTSVSGEDGDALRARPETQEINEALVVLTAGLPVLKVKIYNLDGLVVYSSEAGQIGDDESNNSGFLTAAREGKPASMLSFRDTFSAFSGMVEDRDLVASYLPVRGNDGVIEGVFELYSDVTPLVSRIDQTTTKLMAGLCLIFVLLHGGLLLIVRYADRILKRQHGELLRGKKTIEAHNVSLEERFRTVVNHSPAKIHIKDSEGRYTLVNRHAEKLYGVTDEEARGRTSHEIFPAEIAAAFVGHDRAVLETGQVIEQEEEWPVEGGTRTYLTVKFPILDANGVINAVGAIGTDITERRQAEDALRESEARLHHAQRMAKFGHWSWVVETGEVQYSPEAKAIFGVTPEMALVTDAEYYDLVHPGDRNRVRALTDEVLAGHAEYVIEYRIVKPDGEIRHIHELAEVVYDGAGTPVTMLGTLQDITERRQAEEALQVSEELKYLILNSAAEGIYGLDSEGVTTFVNSSGCMMLGYEVEELIGQPMHALVHHSYPDGTAYPRERCPMYAAFTDGKVHRMTDEVMWRQDGTSFPIEYTSTPIRKNGELIGAVVNFNDITQRKRAEEKLRLAKQNAEIANRAKSEFLANMSHELRTPLNAIIGFSEVIQSEAFGPVGNPKYLEYVRDINESGEHLLDLIKDILDLSKVESGKDEIHEGIIEVSALVIRVVTLVREHAYKEGVVLVSDCPDGLPMLRADERKVKQILLNLLSNAIKFTEAGGRVELRNWYGAGEGHVFRITDTGIGIAEADIPRAMTPFRQIDDPLNRKYEGTGLGLPLAKSLVEMHGGSLELESEPGVGTIVTVRFPIERTVLKTETGT